MRRSSIAVPAVGEPLIVVEESGADEETDSSSGPGRGPSVDMESPPDPYLLSPWRDTRKRSLPTPACTSGPTASQVRRLSERGAESAAREAREAAFLATLSQSTPHGSATGGRRHSVVTISRVPQALFGRGRRESIAAFPALSRRRDSIGKACPPSTENLGSTHNLQLDIMDDIVAARKVRMRLWNTSKEKLCEVQPLDERSPGASSVRYTRGRRHSDFVGAPLAPIPSRRRASELPPPPPIPPRSTGAGIVCTDTDLHRLLDALTSSATEIDRCGDPRSAPSPPNRRRRLADARSSSFDASALHERLGEGTSGWFARRHQTLAVKKKGPEKQKTVTFKEAGDAAEVVWDGRSGSVVDASALGSAIEVFLRKNKESGSARELSPPPALPARSPRSPVPGPALPPRPVAKTPARPPDKPPEDGAEACETSLCSTLKDLFVK